MRVGGDIDLLQAVAHVSAFRGGTETNHSKHLVGLRLCVVIVELDQGVCIGVDRTFELEDHVVVRGGGIVVIWMLALGSDTASDSSTVELIAADDNLSIVSGTVSSSKYHVWCDQRSTATSVPASIELELTCICVNASNDTAL